MSSTLVKLQTAVMSALKTTLPDSAIWSQQGKWVAEITREQALTLFNAALEVVLEQGGRLVMQNTPMSVASDRAVVVCKLELHLGNGAEVVVSGIGEGVLQQSSPHQGTGEVVSMVSDTAVRAAETRAFKRALEALVPAAGALLRRFSDWLTAWAAKNPRKQGESYGDYIARMRAAARAAMSNGKAQPQPQPQQA